MVGNVLVWLWVNRWQALTIGIIDACLMWELQKRSEWVAWLLGGRFETWMACFVGGGGYWR